jgi:hypothetical protein
VAALIAILVLGTLVHNAERRHATLRDVPLPSGSRGFTPAQAPTATQGPPPTEPAASPPTMPSSGVEAAAAPQREAPVVTPVPVAAAPLAPTIAAARPDLSGSWRGAYVDASGKQLLRVVNLSINRVHDDGGIEGTLQYQAASGDGECKLHPRGSSFLAGEQRLQLSPESCSPHYPKELGVPLDFEGVNPQSNILKDGRIEAPAGQVIRVKLKRVSGV